MAQMVQAKEEEEERIEVYLLPQFTQAVVTKTKTLLIILEAGKFKVKSPAEGGSCEGLLPGALPLSVFS